MNIVAINTRVNQHLLSHQCSTIIAPSLLFILVQARKELKCKKRTKPQITINLRLSAVVTWVNCTWTWECTTQVGEEVSLFERSISSVHFTFFVHLLRYIDSSLSTRSNSWQLYSKHDNDDTTCVRVPKLCSFTSFDRLRILGLLTAGWRHSTIDLIGKK